MAGPWACPLGTDGKRKSPHHSHSSCVSGSLISPNYEEASFKTWQDSLSSSGALLDSDVSINFTCFPHLLSSYFQEHTQVYNLLLKRKQ